MPRSKQFISQHQGHQRSISTQVSGNQQHRAAPRKDSRSRGPAGGRIGSANRNEKKVKRIAGKVSAAAALLALSVASARSAPQKSKSPKRGDMDINVLSSKIERDTRFRSDMEDSVTIKRDGVEYHAKAFGGGVAKLGDEVLREAGVNLNIPALHSFNAQIDVVDISGNVVGKTESAVSLRRHSDDISLLSDEPFEGQDKFDTKVKDHIAKFDKPKRIKLLSQIAKTQILGYSDIITSRNLFVHKKTNSFSFPDCDSFGTPFFDMQRYCSGEDDYRNLVEAMQRFIKSDEFFEAWQRKLDFFEGNIAEGEESFFYIDHDEGFKELERILENGARESLLQKNKYPDLDSFYYYKGKIIYASWCERNRDLEVGQDIWKVARDKGLVVSVDKGVRTVVLSQDACNSYYMLQPVGDVVDQSAVKEGGSASLKKSDFVDELSHALEYPIDVRGMDDPRHDLQKQVGGYWKLEDGIGASIADDIMRHINPGNIKAKDLDLRLIQYSKNIYSIGSQRSIDKAIKSMSDYIDQGRKIPGFSELESEELSKLYKENVHNRENYDEQSDYSKLLDRIAQKYQNPISIAALYGVCDIDDPQNVFFLNDNPEPIFLDLDCQSSPNLEYVLRFGNLEFLKHHINSPLHQHLKKYVLDSLKVAYGADSFIVKNYQDSFTQIEEVVASGDLQKSPKSISYPTIVVEQEGLEIGCDELTSCEVPRAIKNKVEKTDDGFSLAKEDFALLNKVKPSHPMEHSLPLTKSRLDRVTGRVSKVTAKEVDQKFRDGTEL